MCTRDYDSYLNAFNTVHINEDIWKSVSERNEITLLIGAGVTSCLVGNWDELLNELAVLRGVSSATGIKPEQLRDYLTCKCDGCFFPKEMNVLEKGEYLRYSPTDQRVFENKERMAQCRETVFAGRVACAINRLIYRHLCDGAGTHVVDCDNIYNYKKDFINWCHNTVETPFKIERKVLCKNLSVEEKLEAFSVEDIIDKLNSWYDISIDDYASLLTLFNSRTDIIDRVYDMFSNLFKGKQNNTFRTKIKDTLSHKDLAGKSAEEKMGIFIRKIAAYLLWRPSYETLETLLTLCIYRKVSCVITYNFDTIFDRLLNDSEIQILLKTLHKLEKPNHVLPELKISVYGNTKDEPYELKGFDSSGSTDVLPVIHVHGIVDDELPQPEPVIFSETSYVSYQQLLLNPGGMKLAEACRRGSLLCVGFSGVDSNFRSVMRQIVYQKNAPIFSAGRVNKFFLTRSLEEVLQCYRIEKNMSAADYEVAFLCANTFLDMQQHYYQNEVEAELLWEKDFEHLSERLKKTFGIS